MEKIVNDNGITSLFEGSLVTKGEYRWGFVFLKLDYPNAESIDGSNIIA